MRLVPRTIRDSALAALILVVTSSPIALAEAQPPPSAKSDSAKTNAAVEKKSSEESGQGEQAQKDPAWIVSIDGFFEDYLVKPLALALFFDFGSSRWLDPDGDGPAVGPSIPFVVVWLVLGASFFTIRMGFINFRGFWHGLRLTRGDYDNPNETGEVTHFQALASALSATVGLGNIAGVAIAVGTGGPGAIFWMVIIGLIGMTSKFVECTLAQMYRQLEPDGTVLGGPMRYLKDGLGELGFRPLGSVLAIVFAVLCVGASFGGGCAFQVNQSLGPLQEQVPLVKQHPWIYGLIMVVMVGIVIIGGIRRIAATASKVVPTMCAIYILISVYILLKNYTKIDDAFGIIFSQAFSNDPAIAGKSIAGGFLGMLVIGVKRASFSNEAGVGSAAIAHAAAKTEEPVREGIVAMLGPFIDTVLICTMTGLVIVITGVYSDPQYADLVGGNKGAILTARAWGGEATVFPYILCVAVVLFAYSTMISWSYYGERCWVNMFGIGSSLAYKLLFLVFVFLGSIVAAKNVLDFSDMLILAMAFPNMLGVALLSGKVRAQLDNYWNRYKVGEFDRMRQKG